MRRELKKLIREWLIYNGVRKNYRKVIEEYENEQEWNGNIMTTGNSHDEVLTWLRINYGKTNLTKAM